jgi:hypothetical protein
MQPESFDRLWIHGPKEQQFNTAQHSTARRALTDHVSGRIFGRASATKAPPADWINSWLASNSPQCPNKYVRMDGGGKLGKCHDIHRKFANFGYVVDLTSPDSSQQCTWQTPTPNHQ